MFETFDIVVAVDLKRCIGKDGGLPWHLPGELKKFRQLTTETTDPCHQNAIIMGRKTWESFPENRRPLPKRHNIVVSRTLESANGARIARSLDEAIEIARELNSEKCFVIGGGEIYDAAMKHPLCNILYLTQIQFEFDCDTFFPPFEDRFEELSKQGPFTENDYSYLCYALKRKDFSHEKA
jgi:dihydrofolate reductase